MEAFRRRRRAAPAQAAGLYGAADKSPARKPRFERVL